MRRWGARLWAHRDADGHRGWARPAEPTSEKAARAVASPHAGSSSWLSQLGGVCAKPTDLGGQSKHARGSRRWRRQAGSGLAQWLAPLWALWTEAPGGL